MSDKITKLANEEAQWVAENCKVSAVGKEHNFTHGDECIMDLHQTLEKYRKMGNMPKPVPVAVIAWEDIVKCAYDNDITLGREEITEIMNSIDIGDLPIDEQIMYFIEMLLENTVEKRSKQEIAL